MAQVQLETTLTITDTNSTVTPITSTKTITYTSKLDKEYSLADTTVQTVWDVDNSAVEPVGDYDLLYVVSDQTGVYVELANYAGGATDDVAVVELASGVPLVLGSDDTLVDYSTVDGLASSTSATFDRVRVKNSSGATATVRVLLFT